MGDKERGDKHYVRNGRSDREERGNHRGGWEQDILKPAKCTNNYQVIFYQDQNKFREHKQWASHFSRQLKMTLLIGKIS
jgi:hypothetical protein